MSIDRKREILNAFMRLASHFGFDKTTMQDVAQEVGISVGVIYKDFKNKEDLVEAYAQQIRQQFLFSMDQILEQDLPAEQLLHDIIIDLFQNVSKLIKEDRGFWQFLKGDGGFKYFRKHKPYKNNKSVEIAERIESIIAKGVQEGIFSIEDVPKTTKIFLDATQSYFSELLVFGQDQHMVLANIEDMLAFLIRAIKK